MINLRVLTKEEWDLIKETEYAKECSKLAYSKRIVCPDTIYEQFFNKEPIAKRLGKYRFTKAQYLINPPEVCDFHIDRYEPNAYYGNESKYIDKGDYYYDDKFNYYISKSLFSKPEYCYAVASFTRKESNWELHIYYDDVFNDSDFIEIAKYGFEQLKNYPHNDEDYD